MDTRNGEDCYPLSGQRLKWLYRQVTTPTASSLARKLSWQWLQGFDAEIRFSSRTFNDSCGGRFSLWSNVRGKCAFAVKIELRTHEDRQGITSNELVADPFSISCYVMPIWVILLVMDTFGAGAAHVFRLMWHCSRFQFSCSCSKCTCRNPSLHPSNYAGYV